MQNSNSRSVVKDLIYEFLKEPTRANFHKVVFNGSGEQDNCDFKEKWLDDYEKIAQIILGMANSSGGAIVIGVKENDDGTTEAIGLDILQDKEKIHSKIVKFLPDSLKFEIGDFDFSDIKYERVQNKKFQVIFVYTDDENLPYIWNRDSRDAQEGCIYIRRGTKTVKANGFEIQKLIDKRIRASYTDISTLELKEHLNQLKILYSSIDSSYTRLAKNPFLGLQSSFKNILGPVVSEPNPQYPGESYDEFVRKMIDRKKIKIERVLDLK